MCVCVRLQWKTCHFSVPAVAQDAGTFNFQPVPSSVDNSTCETDILIDPQLVQGHRPICFEAESVSHLCIEYLSAFYMGGTFQAVYPDVRNQISFIKQEIWY